MTMNALLFSLSLKVQIETNGTAICKKCNMTVRGSLTSYSVNFIVQLRDGETRELTAFERSIVEAFPLVEIDVVAEEMLSTCLKIVAGRHNIVHSLQPINTWRVNQ